MEATMTHPAATLDAHERAIVLKSIQEVCAHMSWHLHAAHVRSNHVHIVVTSRCPPEAVMARLKAYASRALNHTFGTRPRRWTRHGSTRYLRNEISLAAAIEYVVKGHGITMSVYATTTDPEPEHERRGDQT